MSDLLPPNATHQERDISLAIDRLPDVPIKTLWTPATCPEAHLPWLAWALSVDEWDAAWPTETKRSVIAESIEQHRKKGTVGALKRALQRLGYEVEIDERTGTAYTFRLRFKVREGESAVGAVMESAITKATQVALRQKNARSELIGTSLLAEGGKARLFAGAAPISGAEVEIKSAATPALPLDDYNVGLLGSFWTVKMRSSYKGPIARVKRDSDGALLTYYNLLQLRRFVGAGSFKFVRLFNQTGNGVATTTSTNMAGEFDANGFPRISAASDADFFTFGFPSKSFSKMTIAASSFHVGDDDSNYDPTFQIGATQTLLFNRDFNLKMPFLFDERRSEVGYNSGYGGWGVSVVLETPVGQKGGAGIARFNATVLHTHVNGATDDTTAAIVGDVNFKYFNIFPGNSNDPIYGGAFWNADLGATSAQYIIEKIETYLDL